MAVIRLAKIVLCNVLTIEAHVSVLSNLFLNYSDNYGMHFLQCLHFMHFKYYSEKDFHKCHQAPKGVHDIEEKSAKNAFFFFFSFWDDIS